MQRAHLYGWAFCRGRGGGSAECTQEERRPLMARKRKGSKRLGSMQMQKRKGSLHADLLNDFGYASSCAGVVMCYVAGVVMLCVIIKGGMDVASCYKICKLKLNTF
jgi:hypothetical protein